MLVNQTYHWLNSLVFIYSIIYSNLLNVSEFRSEEITGKKNNFRLQLLFIFMPSATPQMWSPNKHCFKIRQCDHRGNFISETSLDESDKS